MTGAKGTRMCWQPGETGDRSNSEGTEWADRKPQGEQTEPPSNIENPTQETSTADKGGISGNGVGGSFVIGGGSGTGNKGGQGNTGEGGSGSNGTGTGTGNGDGDDDGPGGPGQGLGDLYEGTDKTVESVFSAYRAQVMNTDLMSFGTGIFGGCSGGGSCPAETWTASDWGISADLTLLCSGVLATLVAFAGWVALAGMGFFAWKVAVL